MNDMNNPIDVAIIGGGVSGIYTGWRLLGADGGTGYSDPKPSVHLFEQSDRLGRVGRRGRGFGDWSWNRSG